MYIRKVKKRNKGSDKVYEYLHLVEGVRTVRGSRQRLILNLGKLDIGPDDYKALANSIENRLTGQSDFFKEDPKIGELAGQAAKRIRKKREQHIGGEAERSEADVRHVNINSIAASEARSVGGEYVCHRFWEQLGFPEILSEMGIGRDMQKVMEASVVGRLVDPGSELHTYTWAEKRSALYELIGAPERYTLQSFYRAGDLFLKHKDHLEKQLSHQEKDLFSLSEKICLFDLTNTYFEGQADSNAKAQWGRSKEKRSDCKLLTLALIIDAEGFVKYSRLYAGNQYEGHTLKEMITDLMKLRPDMAGGRTVVLDAGIANAKNIAWLKGNRISYIVVNRGKSIFQEHDTADMHVIRRDEDFTMEVKRCTKEGEAYLLCRSSGRHAKDSAIRSRQEKLFIERLEQMREGLGRKGCTKRYSKLLEMIGRVREKYPRASKMYQVTVIPQSGPVPEAARKAIDITWTRADSYSEAVSLDGCYVLRTDCLHLSDTEIWELHTMLTRVESAFRSMKSSLGLRPIFHHKEDRSDAHLFISVLAYHILHAIEWKSRRHGDNRFWSSIRDELSTHQRLTIEFDQHTETGIQHHHLRLCTRAEPGHDLIYRNLGLKSEPISRRMCTI
jgi:transposase